MRSWIKRASGVIIALVLVIAACLVYLISRQPAGSEPPQQATLQFARADWLVQEPIVDPAELRTLHAGLHTAEQVPSALPNHEPPLYQLLFSYQEGQSVLYLTHDLRVFNQTIDREVMLGPVCLELLSRHIDDLRGRQFGELLPWSEAKQLIPLYSTFSITDLETGLTFRTQRRAGSQHADIQPLSRADTAVLKTIYQGEWNWDRRAVIVEIGGRRIAASMNGMPHGAGALVNGFPGHHCLHFLGSSTHGGGRSDPVHQLMVHRAAGLLAEYLDQMPPAELQELALEMAGQGDTVTVGLLIINSGIGLEQLAGQIRNIKLWSSQVSEIVDGCRTGKYSVSVFFRDDQREYRQSVTVTCRYVGNLGKWLIEPDFLQQLVDARN